MITTPIADFLKDYGNNISTRLHMPGHKGVNLPYIDLPYKYDITEVTGADNLYAPNGIIAKSEKHASDLFGCKTVYSTEGSSQCVKAMLYLALIYFKKNHPNYVGRPYIVAARNVHRAFVHAVALLDLDVVWLMPDAQSDVYEDICTCPINLHELTEAVNKRNMPPIGVFVTYPDYLGSVNDLQSIANICHGNDTLLLTDSAHGAYFRFLDYTQYPQYKFAMEYADIACSSAHKTLPVLTGGAYLHISDKLQAVFPIIKKGMSLFGSTSPSYLILASLDACNKYLAEGYRDSLKEFLDKMNHLKERLADNGWMVPESDPLRLTVRIPSEDMDRVISALREEGIEPEYIGEGVVVMMFTPMNSEDDFAQIIRTFSVRNGKYDIMKRKHVAPKTVCSMRDAVLGAGALTNRELLTCPPAIPELMPNEKPKSE